MQRILKAHDAEAHRPVLQVRCARLFNGVIIDINHVVEHAHRDANGLLQLDLVEHKTARATFGVLYLDHVIDEID